MSASTGPCLLERYLILFGHYPILALEPSQLRHCVVAINKVELIRCSYLKGIPRHLSKEGNSFLVKTGDSYIRLIEWSSPLA